MSETQPQLTGKMFLFERPELLSKDRHGGLGFGSSEGRFKFCSKVRGFPINVSEIATAIRDYPVFVVNYDKPMLIAATGVIDDVNLFIDEDGNWEPTAYVPAYVRRYPFGIAADNDGDRFAIVIDTAFDGLVEGGDFKLFENDEPTEATNKAIEFCRAFEADRAMTVRFCEQLKELNLLEGQHANYAPDGSTDAKPFAEYIGVSDKAIKDLTADQLVKLRDNGILPLIYAMQVSLGNWPMLLQRRALRYKLTGADVLKPMS